MTRLRKGLHRRVLRQQGGIGPRTGDTRPTLSTPHNGAPRVMQTQHLPLSSRPTARRRLAAVAAAAIAALGLTSLSATPALAADVTHTIAEVQGTGASTPLAGQTVTVEGI